MPAILTLEQNTKGRDFVVGDLHGSFALLERALAVAQFDPERDRLISVGDLIDRGEQSPRCLEFLRQPWFFAVRGNHEQSFLDMVKKDGSFDHEEVTSNIRNGMGWLFGETPQMLADIRRAFEALPLAIETVTDQGTVGFIHAEVPAGMDWAAFKLRIAAGDELTLDSALLSRERVRSGDADGVAGIGRLFSGHTPQKNGPTNLGNCFYVDTGGVFRLTLGEERGALYCLTVSIITAEARLMTAPPENPQDQHKVVKDHPARRRPFGFDR